MEQERRSQERSETEETEGSSGIFDRARNLLGSAREGAKRSAEVMTGSDIRRFEEFADATTTVVVGVHRDQADLRERLTLTEQSVADLQQGQADLRESLTRTEQSAADLQQGQADLRERFTRTEQSVADLRERLTRAEQPAVTLSRWTIAFGAVSAVALLLSIAAMVIGIS